LRWVNSLGQPPREPERKKFEYIYKVSGIRYLKTVGEKISFKIHLYLNVRERNQNVDYSLGDHSWYTVNCEIRKIEGPGLASHKKPAIITAKIISVKLGGFVFNPPEKYDDNPELEGSAKLPSTNTVLRILYDPKKTVDEYEGLILSIGSDNYVLRDSVRINPYFPPKYQPILERVQANPKQQL